MSIIKGTNQIVAGFGGTKRSIGEVYFSQSALATDNSGALPLFTGETIASANTIYPEFYNWVLAHTELQCTSTEYEASLTTYGECAKYVIGSGSLRLPLIKNYIKAANPSEGIKNIEAGLPNITGTTSDSGDGNSNQARVTGAFFVKETSIKSNKDDQWRGLEIGFDASRSSNVYGKSDTVTPASTTLYPWVVAYTEAIPASTAQAAEFQQGLSGKADTNLGNVPSNYDYVVESYSDDSGNWYRLYKSGWVEQGGHTTNNIKTITLNKPFANTNYVVFGNIITNSTDVAYNGQVNILEKTKTTFSFPATTSSKRHWFAVGQGAN